MTTSMLGLARAMLLKPDLATMKAKHYLLSALIPFAFAACSEKGTEAQPPAPAEESAESTEEVTEAAEEAAEAVTEAAEEATEAAGEAIEEAAETAGEAVEEAAEAASEATEAAGEALEGALKEAEEATSDEDSN